MLSSPRDHALLQHSSRNLNHQCPLPPALEPSSPFRFCSWIAVFVGGGILLFQLTTVFLSYISAELRASPTTAPTSRRRPAPCLLAASSTEAAPTSKAVADPLSHSKYTRDVEPSAVPIFCVFRNSGYREFRNILYRPGHIPISYCTHVLYYSAKHSSTAIISRDEIFDDVYQGFTITANLKRSQTRLKVLLALYVNQRETAEFSHMIEKDTRIDTFCEATYSWLNRHQFDGINVDWPFAGGDCGHHLDSKRLARLLTIFKARFDGRYLLLVTIPHDSAEWKRGFDVELMTPLVNFVVVGSYEGKTPAPGLMSCPGPRVAPLYAAFRNVVPENKLCFSISLKVYTYNISRDSTLQDIRPRPAERSRYTGRPGLRSFSEVCAAYNVTVDHRRMCARGWISPSEKLIYENAGSLTRKVAALNKSCIVLWHIELDDFEARCTSGAATPQPWPLVAAVYTALN